VVFLQPPLERDRQLAKPNYAFAKRQRDLAKKQKREEKRKRKLGAEEPAPAANTPQPPEEQKATP
jgi:hypothetical protein